MSLNWSCSKKARVFFWPVPTRRASVSESRTTAGLLLGRSLRRLELRFPVLQVREVAHDCPIALVDEKAKSSPDQRVRVGQEGVEAALLVRGGRGRGQKPLRLNVKGPGKNVPSEKVVTF